MKIVQINNNNSNNSNNSIISIIQNNWMNTSGSGFNKKSFPCNGMHLMNFRDQHAISAVLSPKKICSLMFCPRFYLTIFYFSSLYHTIHEQTHQSVQTGIIPAIICSSKNVSTPNLSTLSNTLYIMKPSKLLPPPFKFWKMKSVANYWILMWRKNVKFWVSQAWIQTEHPLCWIK